MLKTMRRSGPSRLFAMLGGTFVAGILYFAFVAPDQSDADRHLAMFANVDLTEIRAIQKAMPLSVVRDRIAYLERESEAFHSDFIQVVLQLRNDIDALVFENEARWARSEERIRTLTVKLETQSLASHSTDTAGEAR